MEKKMPVKVIPHNCKAHPYCAYFMTSFGARIKNKAYYVLALTFGFVSLNFPFALVLVRNEQGDDLFLLVLLFICNRFRKYLFQGKKCWSSQRY